MSSSMTRTQAKRLTLIAQGSAVLLLGGAVAVGMVGLPAQSSPDTAAINPVGSNTAGTAQTDPVGTTQDSPRARIHVGSVAERLSMVDNAPDLPEVVVENPTGPIVTEPTPTGPGLGNIVKRLTYIGYISETGSPAAFVRIDGAQRIVREDGVVAANDEMLGDLTVKTIRPQFIIATDGELEAKIRLGTRTGQAITMANGNEITPAAVEEITPEYDERILGDPNTVPQRVLDRRKRVMERSLRGENPRTEASRYKLPENRTVVGLNNSKKKKSKDPEDDQ